MHNIWDIVILVVVLLTMYCLLRALILWGEFADHWMHDPTQKLPSAKTLDSDPPK